VEENCYTDSCNCYQYFFSDRPVVRIINGVCKFEKQIEWFMEEIIKIESAGDYNKMLGIKTLHPLVSVIDSVEKP
jgi:hypothetical protein